MPSDDSPSAHTTSSYLTGSRCLTQLTGFCAALGCRRRDDGPVGWDGWQRTRSLIQLVVVEIWQVSLNTHRDYIGALAGIS
jgi:hypothetical protein